MPLHPLSHLVQATRPYSWRTPPKRSRRSTPPGRERDYVGRLTGPALVYPLMRRGVEVVVDELGQHLLQVAAAKDEQMVQHLPPC